MVSSSVTRRTFVAGAFGTAAAAVLAVRPGSACASEDVRSWDREADVVVMGFGGAGAVAAIEAARRGSSVIVCEKAPEEYAGGNTICSSASAKIPNNPNSARELIRRLVVDAVTDEEIDGIVAEGQGIVDWLQDACGAEAKVLDISKSTFAGEPYGDSFNMITFGTGEALFSILKDTLNAQDNAEVLYQIPVTALVVGDGNEVLGVIAEEEGTPIAIKARKGVVLACGGFENNHRLVEDFSQPNVELYVMGTPYNTGDGFPLLSQVNARIRHTANVEFGAHCVRQASRDAGVAICMSNGYSDLTSLLFVNRDGKRFMNETRPSSISHAHPAHDKSTFEELLFDGSTFTYPNYPYWFVFDETRRLEGPIASWAAENASGTFAGVHQIQPWSLDNAREIESGYILKGETIQELAEKMGVDPDNLAATVDAYNAACAGEAEDEMGRTVNLEPLATGPFYACEMALAYLNTFGSPERDARHRVLDWNGNAVPRLYAVGEFGSTWCRFYSGANNIPEVLGAYVAGADAADLDPWA